MRWKLKKEAEQQLKDSRKQLLHLHPPASVNQLLPILDELLSVSSVHTLNWSNEFLLFSRFLSKLRNIYSVMKALIHDGLSRHSDVDVKVADAVTSSISEITRITAPDAPYNDEQMRDAFN
ncbi:unnamed protein product [Lactuca virosa]|uniref:Uncharacterized protein n=1 Tax=Lactuca virosa TaxID=75947 RepID=A0AAU9PSN3_9ASTR|nr:unnamed protein product [Lactuca virosa]